MEVNSSLLYNPTEDVSGVTQVPDSNMCERQEANQAFLNLALLAKWPCPGQKSHTACSQKLVVALKTKRSSLPKGGDLQCSSVLNAGIFIAFI